MPGRIAAAVHGYLQAAAGHRMRLDVDLEPTGRVRLVRQPAPVGRKGRRTLDGGSLHEGTETGRTGLEVEQPQVVILNDDEVASVGISPHGGEAVRQYFRGLDPIGLEPDDLPRSVPKQAEHELSCVR